MKGLGVGALPAILVIGVMLLASLAPLIQPAAAQQGSVEASTTASGPGYGLVVALRASVGNVEALFKAWGVPENSTLWARLQQVNNSIGVVEELVKQGKLDEARREAAKLFRELGSLVSEAARLYASRLERVGVDTQKLLANVSKVAALVRATVNSLEAMLHRLEAAMKWAEESGATCDNVAERLRAATDEISADIATGKELLNEAISLRLRLLSGNISVDEAVNLTKQLEEKAKAFLGTTSRDMLEARVALAGPHACKAMRDLRQVIKMLRERIANITEEAEKLKQEGKTRAAKALEERAEMLRRLLYRYEALLNKTSVEIAKPIARPHMLGDIIEIIKIRHMMPGLIGPIIKKRFHILPIVIMPISSIDKAFIELKMLSIELRAASSLVPGNLSTQYSYVVGNVSRLVSVLGEYRAGKAGKGDVVEAAKAALQAIEEFKEALKKYRGEAQGSGHKTASQSATRTSTEHRGSSTTPRHGGSKEAGAGMGIWRGGGSFAESGKLGAVMHLVDKAEAVIKRLLVLLGSAKESTGSGIELRLIYREIALAERFAAAASKLAIIAGNDTLAQRITGIVDVLEKAKKALVENNITAASMYLGKALNITKQLADEIEPTSWLKARIKMFLDKIVTVIETMEIMMPVAGGR